MSTKLFVGNLSFNTTENEIHEAYSAHGTVIESNLMMDRMSGRSRGFAFVTMSTPEEAQKAIEAMIAVVDAPNPPRNLLLGRSAYEHFRGRLAAWDKNLTEWEATSLGADFPQETK